MKPYQITGLSFLVYLHENGMNGILGDEMGLGKTLQTLSLLVHLKDQSIKGSLQLPHLIICPLSVLSSWSNEIKRWTSLKHLTFHGTKARRKSIKDDLIGLGVKTPLDKSPDLVVATYESYLADQNWFKHRSWGYVILDEGHRIKNENALLTRSLQNVRSINRLVLTGTPVQNNLVELWSLFHWLMPAVFPESTRERFSKAFDLNTGSYDPRMLNSSQTLLKVLMLRRTKESVKGQLTVPNREEIDLYLPMSSCQRFWSKRLIMRCDSTVLNEIFNADAGAVEINPAQPPESVFDQEQVGEPSSAPSVPRSTQKLSEPIEYALKVESGLDTQSYKRLMNLLMQLRKVCNHPYLMPNSEPEPFEIAEHLVDASAKLVMLDKILKSELPKGKKVLIFSSFTTMLNILEDFLCLRSVNYLRLDGSTPVARRNLSIRLFQQTKTMESLRSHDSSSSKDFPIFLISTKAGGLGINLTAADTVIMYDSSWNPQVDIQAIARAHRIGQTKKVTVYRFICAESVEQQMIGRLRKKLYLSMKIMDSQVSNENILESDLLPNMDDSIDDEANHMKQSMSARDLCAILRGGASSLHKHWGQEVDDSDPALLVDEDESSGYNEFLKASFEEILDRNKAFAQREQAKLKLEVAFDGKLDPSITDPTAPKLIEEEEAALLQGVELVQCRLFGGKRYYSKNKDIGHEWQLAQSKRVSKSTTVVIDGHIVQKNSITSAPWQAVQTLTSDPLILAKLQEPKRKRKQFEHEDSCMACHGAGNLFMCSHCPRVAHYRCLGYTAASMKKAPGFICSQHRCVSCHRATAEAGGMLYRCQTCPDSYCEDCLPVENFYSMGDTLPEFLLLGYGANAYNHYIRCVECLAHFDQHPEIKALWHEEEKRILAKLALTGT